MRYLFCSFTLLLFTLSSLAGFALAQGPRPAPPPLPEAAPKSTAAAEDIPTDPLHQRIDQLIAAATPKFAALAAPIASDEAFVRRVYLDLIGRVPSAAETRAFLSAEPVVPNKREQLINRLLASPEHARRLQFVFDEMLMERRAGTDVPDVEWRNWLRKSFRENRPWNKMVAEMLSADGTDAKTRPAAKFILDRKLDQNLIARDIGRVFLGVDLECAQCHDHPSIDGYLQRHYYGINAFLSRTYVFTDPKSKKKVLAEKAEGEVKFTSVFTSEEGETPPRLLNLTALVDPKGMAKQYAVKPDKTHGGVPKYSRRLQLARQMIADENIDFRRNIVNRLWAAMMGRGLVEPLDLRHADNPPSHPKVLALLADEFAGNNYDIRWLLKELAMTDTYQRASRPASDSNDTATSTYAVAILKPLSPEQLCNSVMQVSGLLDQSLLTAEAELAKADTKNKTKTKADPIAREAALAKVVKPHVDQFVLRFAGQGGQKTTFDTTADQALFLSNGPLVQSWLVPTKTNLTARLQSIQDSREFAEELFIAVFSRLPTQDEVAEVAAYLAAVENRAEVARELTWALLASAEFRFNH